MPYVGTALFLALSQIGLTEQYRARKSLAPSINVRQALDLLISLNSWDRKGVVVDLRKEWQPKRGAWKWGVGRANSI